MHYNQRCCHKKLEDIHCMHRFPTRVYARFQYCQNIGIARSRGFFFKTNSDGVYHTFSTTALTKIVCCSSSKGY